MIETQKLKIILETCKVYEQVEEAFKNKKIKYKELKPFNIDDDGESIMFDFYWGDYYKAIFTGFCSRNYKKFELSSHITMFINDEWPESYEYYEIKDMLNEVEK